MTPAELRRQWRAARTMDYAQRTQPARDRAAAILAAALADAEAITVPGYTVRRAPDGAVHVAPMPASHPDQLALWRTADKEPTQ